MMEKNENRLVPWTPEYLLTTPSGDYPRKPLNANDHFIVNSARRIIMRAMVSSRFEVKKHSK
jgi:hypothetical protein